MSSSSTLPACFIALLVFPLAGCGGGGPVLPPDKGGDITVDPTRRPDAGPQDATSGDGPVTSRDGGTTGDGGPEPSDGGPPPVDAGPLGEPPVLSAIEASQAGRDGLNVHLTLTGSDVNKDFASLIVRFLDSNDTELLIVDSDLDGSEDSGYLVVGPNTSVQGDEEFTAEFTLEGLFVRAPEIAKVEAYALDSLALVSNIVQAPVGQQAVLVADEACDERYIMNRCEEGLGCAGTPATCVAGSPPSLSNFAYYSTTQGLKILVSGEDQDDDLTHVVLEFLDSSGGPIELDLDNDGTPDSNSFEINARGASNAGEFFVQLQPADNFAQLVQGLAATPMDSQRRTGNRMTTRLANPPSRRRAETCDPLGFDACRSGDICYPGIPGVANSCSPIEGQRMRTCADAPVLNPAQGKNHAASVTGGASLWDAPRGCAALDPTGRPEGAVMVDLPDGAQRLTITTDLPGTGFDTVLYVIDGCALNSDTILGCHDNVATGVGSELVLTNLPVGRYLVVVDSWNIFGGAFELSIDVEN